MEKNTYVIRSSKENKIKNKDIPYDNFHLNRDERRLF